jgi:hypothetical protein
LKDEKKQQIKRSDDWDGICERSKRPREYVERSSAPICEAQVWKYGRREDGNAKVRQNRPYK